mgnify:CR=1 FL=1
MNESMSPPDMGTERNAEDEADKGPVVDIDAGYPGGPVMPGGKRGGNGGERTARSDDELLVREKEVIEDGSCGWEVMMLGEVSTEEEEEEAVVRVVGLILNEGLRSGFAVFLTRTGTSQSDGLRARLAVDEDVVVAVVIEGPGTPSSPSSCASKGNRRELIFSLE